MSSDEAEYQQAPDGHPNEKGLGEVNAQGFYPPPQGYPDAADEAEYQHAPDEQHPNEKGFGGPNAQGAYPPQGYPDAQGAYPPQEGYVQSAYPAQIYPPNTYQGPGIPVGPDEYVDRYGYVRKRRKRGLCLAACLACCWIVTWPCHAPFCCGL